MGKRKNSRRVRDKNRLKKLDIEMADGFSCMEDELRKVSKKRKRLLNREKHLFVHTKNFKAKKNLKGKKLKRILRNFNHAEDTNCCDVLKNVLSSRYDDNSDSLNLSRLEEDPVLAASNLCISLSIPQNMATIVRLIAFHFPQLQELNLTENRITSVKQLKGLKDVCPDLKIVNLENNELQREDLNHLRGFNCSELILVGNPLCGEFESRDSYMSTIGQLFPFLTKLDGYILPGRVGIQVEEGILPQSQKCFFASEDVQSLVMQFLDRYYTIYDSSDRTQLLDAYHEEAVFSMVYMRPPKSTSRERLTYVLYDRNLMKVKDPGERFRLLKQGKVRIVGSLAELPPTKHDPDSFSIDIFHVSPGLMSFSVTGVFTEVGGTVEGSHSLLTFNRDFSVAAKENGFVVINESLFIAAATPQQIQIYSTPPAVSIPKSEVIVTKLLSGITLQ